MFLQYYHVHRDHRSLNWEREVIADVVLYNTRDFDTFEIMKQRDGMDKRTYLLVAKLVAILRLANAMDRSHYQKIQGLRVVLRDTELQVILDSARDLTLEMGLLRRQSEFFKEIYGIYPVLKRKRNA